MLTKGYSVYSALILKILLTFLMGCTSEKEPGVSTKELVAKGQKLYAENCVACHGETGQGDGPAAEAMLEKPRNFVLGNYKFGSSFAEVKKTINDGVPGTPMPPWGHRPQVEIEALAAYVLSLKK